MSFDAQHYINVPKIDSNKMFFTYFNKGLIPTYDEFTKHKSKTEDKLKEIYKKEKKTQPQSQTILTSKEQIGIYTITESIEKYSQHLYFWYEKELEYASLPGTKYDYGTDMSLPIHESGFRFLCEDFNPVLTISQVSFWLLQIFGSEVEKLRKSTKDPHAVIVVGICNIKYLDNGDVKVQNFCVSPHFRKSEHGKKLWASIESLVVQHIQKKSQTQTSVNFVLEATAYCDNQFLMAFDIKKYATFSYENEIYIDPDILWKLYDIYSYKGGREFWKKMGFSLLNTPWKTGQGIPEVVSMGKTIHIDPNKKYLVLDEYKIEDVIEISWIKKY